MRAALVRITGRVQGVGYRAWAIETAAQLRLITILNSARRAIAFCRTSCASLSLSSCVIWLSRCSSIGMNVSALDGLAKLPVPSLPLDERAYVDIESVGHLHTNEAEESEAVSEFH